MSAKALGRKTPLPAHGTYARANGSPGHRPPCTCDECLPVYRSTRKRHRLNRARGLSARVSAAPARAHLQRLRWTMSWSAIYAATCCGRHTIQAIANGSRDQIARTTHNKILSVHAAPAFSPGITIDALGTRRRLEALQAEGHALQTIATAAGQKSSAQLGRVLAGQARVRAEFADRIARVYDVLSVQPGTSDAARQRAAARGYLPVRVWDGDIDDSAANPLAPDPSKPVRSVNDLTRAERMAITKAMTLAGAAPREIAERIGRDERTVFRWRREHDWKAAA